MQLSKLPQKIYQIIEELDTPERHESGYQEIQNRKTNN
jgi:hypothetical protein